MTIDEERAGWTDLHNHVIPAVDDGASDADQAVRAVEALVADGVERITATPHVDGSLSLRPRALERRLDELDRGWARLDAALAEADRGRLRRGAEVKLDVPNPNLEDPRLRLGGGSAVLVEFAYMNVPPRSDHTLAALRERGYLPLLAHPERYHRIGDRLSVVRSWVAAGAFLQVNAASLLGQYGKQPRRVAWELLSRGWAHCVASDYHARRAPGLADARAAIEERGGSQQCQILFELNPSRLLASQPCIAVDGLPEEGAVRRWRRWLTKALRRDG